jgi:hypothetical protein
MTLSKLWVDLQHLLVELITDETVEAADRHRRRIRATADVRVVD